MFTDSEIISKNNTITIAKKEYFFDLYRVVQTGIVKAFVHRNDDTFGPFEADSEEAVIETFKCRRTLKIATEQQRLKLIH